MILACKAKKLAVLHADRMRASNNIVDFDVYKMANIYEKTLTTYEQNSIVAPDENDCWICNNDYNNTDRKQLMLPCGHSPCKQCLTKLQNMGNHFCPLCRKSWKGVLIDDLLICRDIVYRPSQPLKDECIPSAPLLPSSPDDSCEKHDSKIVLMCLDCSLFACETCLKIDHMKCSCITFDGEFRKMTEMLHDVSCFVNKRISAEIDLKILNNKTNIYAIQSILASELRREQDLFSINRSLLNEQKCLNRNFDNLQLKIDSLSSVSEAQAILNMIANLEETQRADQL